ncbi:MAG TPA: arsenical pump-driving ATPase [Candidatus Sulfotelmatobacter sp.]|nr:arsenical pump-driving ATPase [Candidatus Sulfotelmatobacter sp.]
MKLLGKVTRTLLFTGKGGVGKTSIACASAVSLAEEGKRVLLVSTDPASNLDEVLSTKLGVRPTPVEAVKGLFGMNVDPEEAARQYRERVVGPYRQLLPEVAVKSIEEQLSGACTVEIAAFDEFAKLLGDPSATADFDHVIFDTAPTGHTLRLLQLPAAWSGFIESSTGGTSCLGPLAGLQAQRELYANTVRALGDTAFTTVFLVARPEGSALAEAERTRNELEALGLRNQRLIVNGLFRARADHDPIAKALELRGRDALEAIPAGLKQLPRNDVPLVPRALIGVEALRRLADGDYNGTNGSVHTQRQTQLPAPLSELIPEIARRGKGVIMTMGKGGVGKTTVAAAIAVALARLGYSVHLTTTDPAGHGSALGGTVPGLEVSRIDPVAEIRAYTEEVVAESGKDLDEKGRALLEEDLRSPCTEEIAVFRAFAHKVDQGNHGFVVIDTAPTGHTLLLLDAANAYHRDVERNLSYIPDSVRRLLPQLRDPDFTKILIVTLPEATPVHEAARLQDDLKRANITPYAWIINQSLYAAGTHDPVLAERGSLEARFIDEVQHRLASRTALIPWQAEAPLGAVAPSETVQAV